MEVFAVNICLASAIAVSAIGALAAQNTPILQKFEVASVKRMDRCEFNTSIDPGSVTLKDVPLKAVLMEAFKVKSDQIEGPSWLDADCFEISAKMPKGATRDQLPAMLQAVLIERLVVDKGGPKFKEDDPNTNFMGEHPRGSVMFGFGGGRYKGVMTMASLASYLSGRGYGPVQDHTGLTGKYDIDLSWTPDPSFEPRGGYAAASAASQPNADGPAAPSADLFTALRESLGLRLERSNGQVEFVVIDHIERVPTEN
jgi:hypothetical protein